jgi:hypothetical protein
LNESRIPRIPPPGHRYPPDVVDHIYQLRGLSLPRIPKDLSRDAYNEFMTKRDDYPPKGSPEEMTLEDIAVQLDYPLPIPADWHPPEIPNLDRFLHNADWIGKQNDGR